MTDKLKKIVAKCKCGIFIGINEHRDYHKTAEKALEELKYLECPPELTDEVRAEMIKRDIIVNITVYPDTPIGSYHIYHWDLDMALDETLAALE